MKCSIVILNWNGAEMLRKYLPSVVRYCPADCEVVVADNGSTDDSRQVLEAEFPSVRTIFFEQNLGFAEGYNQALKQIDSTYCVLLNSDVEVTSGWLTPMLEMMEHNDNIGAMQPKVLAHYDKVQKAAGEPVLFEHAGAAGGYIDRLGYPYCRGRIMGCLEEDHGQYDTEADIFWATGACLVTRTRLFFEVDGLDGLFFAHMEEIDLCWRMQMRGYRIVCQPACTVYHLGGGALPYESPRKTYLNFRNCLLMLYKNTPWTRIYWLMPARLVLDYVAAMQYLIKGQFANAKEVLHARIDYHRMKGKMRGQRRVIQGISIDRYPAMIRPFSILFHFYFLGHKTFDRLGK